MKTRIHVSQTVKTRRTKPQRAKYMKAYKLMRLRADGTLGSLFINKAQILSPGKWLSAKYYPTKGFAARFGWHCTASPNAPHLTEQDRVWCEVEIKAYKTLERPKAQGGLWYLAKQMKIKRKMEDA